ncbi:hypothetical protein [Longispora fulva]|uniref:Secreted protein n=1 Tax=Longispora fulva TaxID=619741 RepID=A0A8J7GS23_9ACTN|nr:hypothetical protein [Longispora fulva]MBG6135961.1 hypothetical protein [Longispora fulva]
MFKALAVAALVAGSLGLGAAPAGAEVSDDGILDCSSGPHSMYACDLGASPHAEFHGEKWTLNGYYHPELDGLYHPTGPCRRGLNYMRVQYLDAANAPHESSVHFSPCNGYE